MSEQHLDTKRVKLAVMSDLHCRLQTDPNDSLLVVGACRRGPTCHPVQSLLELMKVVPLSADLLLVPGDLTNKARLEGLSQGWDIALEVGKQLDSTHVIPVLGNHDIESRGGGRERSHDPIYQARNLRPGFPYGDDQMCQQFFFDGFCILEPRDFVRIILINSVIDHVDEKSAERGTFGGDRIERLKSTLASKVKVPICIAMLHHHPVLHSGFSSADMDVIPTGDHLIAVLKDHGCKLILHGHKHMARLRREDSMLIFAAGSFSALMNAAGSSMGNMFHLIELESSASRSLKGFIKTWTFHLTKGWIPSSLRYRGFPHVTGFGRTKSIEEMVADLAAFAASRPDRFFNERDVLAVAPNLNYSTPDDYVALNQALEVHHLKLSDYDAGRFGLGKIDGGT